MEDGALIASRPAGNEYAVKDDAAVLAFFLAHKDDEPNALVHAVLANADFWGEDLTALPGLEATVLNGLECIFSEGAYEAMRRTL